ncbi:hypothetical protein [Candidatus Albibeggiatoa sp. nov. BB20]
MEENSKDVGVIVEMRWNEINPEILIDKICELFRVKLGDLRWVRET